MLTTEMTGGAVVVAGDDSVACFEPNGQLRWLDSWQQPFEVMAGGKVYTYNNYGVSKQAYVAVAPRSVA
ncbi:hypothetical protein HYH02_007737 [Chlamydomonas schloesseri]|uniref:Uncharacterized protein n=1 Tax=Chlamydomonas schloesseri TaxID=2026947 RepID=A0A836B4J2_9CHLO|nr:hypothetical protein HYH02_007737 [Chlamydomonas schloesseri]|eukprot:KAG2447410.1 hypothetical protein HYH02_007737 [Chlamydomonas schloesseri]